MRDDVFDVLNEQVPGKFNEAFRNAVRDAVLHAQASECTWMIPCSSEWQVVVLDRLATMTRMRLNPVVPA